MNLRSRRGRPASPDDSAQDLRKAHILSATCVASKKGPRQRSLHEALLQLLHCIIVGAELRILRDHARHVGREARRTMHVSRSVLISVCASAHAFATLSKARCAERCTSY
ncbi:hypothetical protein PVAP13_5KG205728 [Panicum virgatum]|uniref:Uncharacterized protein n=1 Tax=Panicum virgatum TaxID=38727 RepID=A0A8T0SJ76_PANVG|nr:hypothetical protein PVAP13_5KG205728 [Panicum virgatum]